MGKFTKDKRVLKTSLYSKKVTKTSLNFPKSPYKNNRTSITAKQKKTVFVPDQPTNSYN